MTTIEMDRLLVDNPATSYWLRRAIQELNNRDIVDVLKDINRLKIYFEQKAKEIGL